MASFRGEGMDDGFRGKAAGLPSAGPDAAQRGRCPSPQRQPGCQFIDRRPAAWPSARAGRLSFRPACRGRAKKPSAGGGTGQGRTPEVGPPARQVPGREERSAAGPIVGRRPASSIFFGRHECPVKQLTCVEAESAGRAPSARPDPRGVGGRASRPHSKAPQIPEMLNALLARHGRGLSEARPTNPSPFGSRQAEEARIYWPSGQVRASARLAGPLQKQGGLRRVRATDPTWAGASHLGRCVGHIEPAEVGFDGLGIRGDQNLWPCGCVLWGRVLHSGRGDSNP